ncbi:MAG: N-acetylmuramoyl-L-alanine amidase, partial [Oscillospiraceae bacterium]|nr:N-acetylmuramoyl-L-alanine amidase [Oscillospiraceae bacterium]
EEQTLSNLPVEEQQTPQEENDSPEETTEGEIENGEETSEGETPSEELIPEETLISFNKPAKMRAAVVNAGKDFLTDPGKSEEEQQAEIDAMLTTAEGYEMNTIIVPLLTEEGSVFSVNSVKSISTFDALDYLITAARERGLFIYGSYDLSLYGSGSDVAQTGLKNTEAANLALDAFKDFIKSYNLDGVLLDGCENPEVAGSYSDYMQYGAGRSYEQYLQDNAEMLVTAARELTRKYSPNTQIGLLTDAVWATLANDESGVDIPAETAGWKETNLNSKELLEEDMVDFMAVENVTSTADTNMPFDTIAKWWDALAAENEEPVYMVHAADRACTTDISAGWAAYDQLTHQMIALEECSSLQGSAFRSLSDLAANPQGSTTLLMDYFSNNVKKEHILTELAFSKPTQLNISTTDKTYTFQGASDPNADVTVDGQVLETDENGFFSYTVELQPGENKYTFTHKAKTMTFTINRQVQVLKEVTPTGSMAVDGGMKVSVTAVAYENSNVMFTINGQNYPMSLDETSGDEDLRGTTYKRYTGSFVVPDATRSIQNLGNIVVTATWEGVTKTMEGASVSVNKIAIVEDGVLVRVTADQAIVFPTNEIGPYPTSSNYRLPKGTLDYAVGEEVTYKSGDDVRKYFKLASGMRVYSSDISAVSDNSLYVANNKITGMTIKADADYTYVILLSDQPVPFAPSYSNTRFSIDFKYTTSVTEDIESLTKNPLFSSATWNDTTLTLGLKTQGAFLGYKAYHEDGKIVFRFNNPTTVKGANIVVDPGHGGADNGAPGFNPNYQEKHINWAIAKKLADELEKKGANVLLLNTINTTMDMDTRLAKAQAFNAQLYICVHHNSASSTATGTEVYYFYPFAQSLASRLSSAISGALNTNNRGARYDVFYVTRDPQFVGILSEGGFMSNNKEYNKLIDDDYQDAVADAMADAIQAFLKNAGSVNAGITGTQSVGGEVGSVSNGNSSGSTSSGSSETGELTFAESSVTLAVGETYNINYNLPSGY